MTHQKLKIRYANGEVISLKGFFSAHYRSFCLFASNYISDQTLCEDIVQDAFVSVMEKGHTFKNQNTLKTYFYTTIHHACLDHIKHERVKERFIEYESGKEKEAEFLFEKIIKQEAISMIYQEISKLPKTGRTVLLLALKGYTSKEIAQELSITVNTVKTHKARAYKVLRSKIDI